MALGAFGLLEIGTDYRHGIAAYVGNGGVNTYPMNVTNYGAAFRFVATQAKPVKAVKVGWNATASGGSVRVTIEGANVAGYPDGTPYDANATVDIVPDSSASFQTCTFATPPSTNLTVGNIYYVVLVQIGTGTNNKLQYQQGTAAPCNILTATDATTRSNLTEVTLSYKYAKCILVYTDDTLDSCGMLPWSALEAIFYAYGASRWAGFKFTTIAALSVRGVSFFYAARLGTPVGNLRCRILDTANNAVANATCTVDADCVKSGAFASWEFYFPGIVSLSAATSYRCVIDNADGDSSNGFGVRAATTIDASLLPTGMCYTFTTDAGSNWTETGLSIIPASLILDSETAGAGGGAINLDKLGAL